MKDISGTPTRLVEGIGHNGELELVEQFGCYESPGLQTVDRARVTLFSKAKTGLELPPPINDPLELHVQCFNHHAKLLCCYSCDTSSDMQNMEFAKYGKFAKYGN